MKQEIGAAVEWWKNALRSPSWDNGDVMCNAFAALAASGRPPIPEEKLAKFGEELSSRLEAEFPKTWKPEEPGWGSYIRAINLSTDYGPFGALREAAIAAGIETCSMRFPCKTTMWCNPGEVRVSYGYGAPIITVFKS